ncbi:MAG: acetyltransferase [Microbacteriaceae bacterium]|nr:acetyltransferase [Microbacteriaceae bacterium]
MALLVVPNTRFHHSFISAVTEFGDARMDGAGSVNGAELTALADEEAFERLVISLVRDQQEDAPRAASFVPATSLWMVNDDELVGFLQVRHRLTPFLLEQGGHIGYSVRPSERRQGYASAALTESLGVAAGLGIEQVLLVCDEENIGSRTVIERAGGVYEDSRAGKRRYWIPTGYPNNSQLFH